MDAFGSGKKEKKRSPRVKEEVKTKAEHAVNSPRNTYTLTHM